jgi:branched-subunit amino acid ABC-type transport system permease component
VYPEAEVLAIYVIVIAVLLLRPAGLFGRQVT